MLIPIRDMFHDEKEFIGLKLRNKRGENISLQGDDVNNKVYGIQYLSFVARKLRY